MDPHQPDHTGEEAPEPPTDGLSHRPRELRIALAMRGGVSLAVWIGGAVAELDLARRGLLFHESPAAISEDEGVQARALAYADLLTAAGYTSLKIDVLAGASAGGLNAVVYGFAQSVGVTLDGLREVWESEGDLWNLMHPQRGVNASLRTEALLRGDDAFYVSLLEQLHHLGAGPVNESLELDHLTIDLAATLQGGPALVDPFTGADLRPREAHFRFRGVPTADPRFNDMPTDGADVDGIKRLAFAARSTSSFPGAFEPAAVFSWWDEDAEVPHDRANMRGVFSEATTSPSDPFDVMDGGVFDNIPIKRAIDAIADAPAQSATKRILIYLDPSPPASRPAAPHDSAFVERDGSWVRVLRARFVVSALRAVTYKIRAESATDDIVELNRLAALSNDIQKRRRGFIERLPQSLDAYDDGDLPGSYRAYRRGRDSARLLALLTEPGAGFLRALVDPPQIGHAFDPKDAARFAPHLKHALGNSSVNTMPDATTLLSACDLFISWVRIYEDAQATPDETIIALGDAKGQIYRVRTVAQYVRDRLESAAVVAAVQPGLTDPGAFPGRAAVVAATLWPSLPSEDPPPDLDLSSDAAMWAAIGQAADSPDSDVVLGRLLAAGWTHLCDAVNGIAPNAAQNPVLAGVGAIADDLTPHQAQDLTMAATLSVGALSTPAVPNLHQITGDQKHPDADLPDVRKLVLALTLDDAVRDNTVDQLPTADTPAMSARSKLAGNSLGNFAGFLSAQWRTHDWDWGRADAGAALIGVIAPDDAPAELRPVANAALTHVTALVDSTGLDGPKPGLMDLGATHRFALATRLLLGLHRVLWPNTPPQLRPETMRSSPSKTVSLTVLLMLLRPVLVAAPLLILHPAAIISAALLVLTSHHVGGGRAAGPTALMVGWLMAAAIVGVCLYTLRKRQRRWQQAWEDLAPHDPTLADLAAEVRDRYARTLRLAVVVGLVVVVVLGAQVLMTTGWRLTLVDLGVVLVTVVAAHVYATTLTATRLARASSDSAAWRAQPAPALVALVAGVMLAGWLLPDSWSSAIAIGIAAAGLAWAIHRGWTRGSVAPQIAVAVGVLAVALTVWGPDFAGWVRPPEGSGWRWLFTPWLVAVVAIGAAWRLDKAASCADGTKRHVLAAILTVVTALGSWLVTYLWGWHAVVPAALIIVCAAAAATTMYLPFRDDVDPVLESAD